MYHTNISISELQKNISSVFRNNSGLQIVTQNNKTAGAVISKGLLDVFEKFGILEEIEDYLLISDPESQKAIEAVEKIDLKTMNDQLLTADDVWK
ncbi:hypothetical protein COB57_03215 [Candidatus Peregrinibacteria bacterium]|nr:MAG: hypothetical protein COB57_03215 [Candidatus Peregrinibacteria bacterium]